MKLKEKCKWNLVTYVTTCKYSSLMFSFLALFNQHLSQIAISSLAAAIFSQCLFSTVSYSLFTAPARPSFIFTVSLQSFPILIFCFVFFSSRLTALGRISSLCIWRMRGGGHVPSTRCLCTLWLQARSRRTWRRRRKREGVQISETWRQDILRFPAAEQCNLKMRWW